MHDVHLLKQTGRFVSNKQTLSNVSEHELNLIKTFLFYNQNHQSQEYRNKFVSLFGKFLIRLKRILYSLFKKNQKSHYRSFFTWIHDLAISGLDKNASFPRSSTSLKILTAYFKMEQFILDDGDFSSIEIPRLQENKFIVHKLLDVLSDDSYPVNRQDAFALLKHFGIALDDSFLQNALNKVSQSINLGTSC